MFIILVDLIDCEWATPTSAVSVTDLIDCHCKLEFCADVIVIGTTACSKETVGTTGFKRTTGFKPVGDAEQELVASNLVNFEIDVVLVAIVDLVD